jgi:putative addiction module component (TIGR02574 family)
LAVAVTIEQVTHEALSLSEEERAQLAHTLLRSLDSVEETEGAQEAWEEEIARRVARVREGTAQGRPGEDVFRDIRARYQ